MSRDATREAPRADAMRSGERMTRVRVALAAVMVAALLPAAGIFTEVVSNPMMFRRRDDPISVFDRRLAPLRDSVRTEREVGYLASPQLEDRAAHLYAVRYALAPCRYATIRTCHSWWRTAWSQGSPFRTSCACGTTSVRGSCCSSRFRGDAMVRAGRPNRRALPVPRLPAVTT